MTTPRTAARAALLAALAACGRSPEEPAARNLILISIDTLRADALGCYGSPRATSPGLDALAAAGVRFESAWAATSWTLPSHVTMLSGLQPETHGVTLPDRRPGPDTELLAETLRAAGFYTFAWTDGGWMGPDFDLDRGFLAFDGEDRPFEDALARAAERIAAAHGERRFFAFVHTFDVHCPYEPGPPYDALFASEGARSIETEGRCGNPHYNALDLGPGEARFLRDRYDGGVRRADDALARFVALLEREGVLRDTVLVVTSDHGEEFLEHGRIGHEATLYPEVLRVPLIVRAPGIAPRVVRDAVGLVDLAPTVCDLLGVPAPADVDGRSLAPLLRGDELPPRPVAAALEWNARLSAYVEDAAQAIEREGALELYDLAADPLAARDLAAERLEAARALRARAEAALPRAAPRAALEALPGAAARAELERLGYAGD